MIAAAVLAAGPAAYFQRPAASRPVPPAYHHCAALRQHHANSARPVGSSAQLLRRLFPVRQPFLCVRLRSCLPYFVLTDPMWESRPDLALAAEIAAALLAL